MDITIRRSDRRRQASIEIHPGAKIIVSIPSRYPESRVQELLEQKKSWIEKKLNLFRSLGPRAEPKKWVSGELFHYLGQSYSLEIIRGKRAPVTVRDQKIIIQLAERDDVKRALIQWYGEQALEIFKSRVNVYSEKMKLAPKSVAIKNYKARWGACRSTGEVFFNWRLVLAPVEIIDYVVVHELAHLKVQNHSPRFWATVQIGMNDYKSVQSRLRTMDFQGLLSL